MPYMPMKHDDDPREPILDKIGMEELGDLPGFALGGNKVLIGIYERTKVTKSGIHLPDQVIKEDEHQGKAGLVLMLGPTAFESDDNYDFNGYRAEPGDWVAIFINDGRKIVVNGQLCRIVADQDIVMKIPTPDSVF